MSRPGLPPRGDSGCRARRVGPSCGRARAGRGEGVDAMRREYGGGERESVIPARACQGSGPAPPGRSAPSASCWRCAGTASAGQGGRQQTCAVRPVRAAPHHAAQNSRQENSRRGGRAHLGGGLLRLGGVVVVDVGALAHQLRLRRAVAAAAAVPAAAAAPVRGAVAVGLAVLLLLLVVRVLELAAVALRTCQVVARRGAAGPAAAGGARGE